MSYIFMDESGDLGFDFTKHGTSHFFIVSCLFIPGSKRPIEKIVHKTHSELSRHLKRHIGELHAFREKPLTRQRLLKRLASKECTIMAIYLNKKKVYTRLHDEKQVLYNYVTNILLDRIYSRNILPADKPISLIASRRETNKFLNENFKDYLQKQIAFNHHGNLRITIKTPSEEKCLQVVDFVSWAIFRKYEHADERYYQILADKINESSLFP